MRIAVLLPCYNEGLSIRKVVSDFRSVLPSAEIYVYDNRSTDNTAEEARDAGAIVRSEMWPGKGNVVRRMFVEVEADVYLMADGDGTYDHSMATFLIGRLVSEGLDMVVGTRRGVYNNANRVGHGFGNRLFNLIYSRLFGRVFSDIFSGYRVFSRRFVKSFPAVSSGFEIETEMSVHASLLKLPIAEIETEYGVRQEGSFSKLSTVRDSLRILKTFCVLFKEIRPALFFGVISFSLIVLAIFMAIPLLFTYLEIGLVPRLPTALLATGMILLAAMSGVSGIVLDSVARARLEQKRIWYVMASSLPGKG